MDLTSIVSQQHYNGVEHFCNMLIPLPPLPDIDLTVSIISHGPGGQLPGDFNTPTPHSMGSPTVTSGPAVPPWPGLHHPDTSYPLIPYLPIPQTQMIHVMCIQVYTLERSNLIMDE
ncbi:hypothetical protein PAXRUDRAFT_621305 [Paxillus rubicundulus Ve08.2h10]|uniref:Uncharacterized protein n=1 Tax=Paxillus rubicundulus Ve08.2h10 TaxID=930991 RepID=A0A0D0DYD6_9AGAM|nr:hypothetical protein PAXRUDRAFT_621305 [Paxillus rubicundulus Ve08.2h10]